MHALNSKPLGSTKHSSIFGSTLAVTSAALRRRFEFDARVPGGVKGVAVAVNRVEKLDKIPKKQTTINYYYD